MNINVKTFTGCYNRRAAVTSTAVSRTEACLPLGRGRRPRRFRLPLMADPAPRPAFLRPPGAQDKRQSESTSASGELLNGSLTRQTRTFSVSTLSLLYTTFILLSIDKVKPAAYPCVWTETSPARVGEGKMPENETLLYDARSAN